MAIGTLHETIWKSPIACCAHKIGVYGNIEMSACPIAQISISADGMIRHLFGSWAFRMTSGAITYYDWLVLVQTIREVHDLSLAMAHSVVSCLIGRAEKQHDRITTKAPCNSQFDTRYSLFEWPEVSDSPELSIEEHCENEGGPARTRIQMSDRGRDIRHDQVSTIVHLMKKNRMAIIVTINTVVVAGNVKGRDNSATDGKM
jgi:hypothetical protein